MNGLPRRIAVLIAGLFIAALAAAQDCPPTPQPFTPEMFQGPGAAAAPDRGPLWRIRKDGATSYLFGTLHVGRREWMPPGPALRAALRETEVLALELDPLDLQLDVLKAYVPRRGAAPLPPPLQKRLDAAWRAECLPAELRLGPPEMQAVGLMSFIARREGFDATYGSEIFLAIAARGLGRRIVALESMEMQMRAIEADTHAEAEWFVGETLKDIESGKARQVLVKVAAAWSAGDLARLENYESWCECMETEAERKLMKRLLDDRNPHLAGRIAELHGRTGKVLAAVGALHMVGPGGLPALLRARGFDVERVR